MKPIEATVNWGIIGCGDVTEKKSGPAFNKVPNSKLVAVMRRNAAKAEDYARRHGVPRWYSDAASLILDPEVNAVYIATPPDSHLHYTRMALEACKPVYVEKPMVLNSSEAIQMQALSALHADRIVVAHYRRYWQQFQKVKQLLDEGAIGKPQRAHLVCTRKPLTAEDILRSGVQWRINPAISGGGLFHDLAPHQIDLLLYWFGNALSYEGFSLNHTKQYAADDTVVRSIRFANDVQFFGLWHFAVPADAQQDEVLIEGTEGTLRFSVFWHHNIYLTNGVGTQTFSFTPPEHNQIYLIEQVVRFFRGEATNPCPVSEGVKGMLLLNGE
jgi:predicted dehydrogenase